MKLVSRYAVVFGLLAGCVADPVSGGDSLSGGSGSGGSDPGTDDSAADTACMDGVPSGVATAYQAALSSGLGRVSELEARFAAAVGDPDTEPSALAEFVAQVQAGFQEVSVTTDWIRCEFTDEHATQSLELCGAGGNVQLCDGPHACEGACTGALYRPGPIACEGTCIGPCELAVATACEGWCAGSCSSQTDPDYTEGTCDGACEGECGVAFGSCQGTCAGGCITEFGPGGDPGPLYCLGECQSGPSECLGRVYTTSASDACTDIADFAAVAGPDCEAPYVVYTTSFVAEVSGDQQAQNELSAFLADARPAMAEVLAVEHQSQMMLDTLVPPPCDDASLEMEYQQLAARLATLHERAFAWALPAGETPWDTE